MCSCAFEMFHVDTSFCCAHATTTKHCSSSRPPITATHHCWMQELAERLAVEQERLAATEKAVFEVCSLFSLFFRLANVVVVFVFVIKIFRVSYYLAASAFPSIWWPLPPKERLLQRGFFLDKAGSGSKGVGSWPRSPLLEGEVIPQQYQKRLGERIWRLQKCPRIRHPCFQKATHKVGTLHAWQRLLCPRCCPCCVRCVVGFPSK